jgi:class 3 adenylate cyclase/tetratricopeptide (TPR) repeat protein
MKKESERRIATVMFADISGFTAMSEKMDPEEVTMLMNECFEMMNSIIERNEGVVDKYIGDCAMVLFGVPTAIENAPHKAINTAIEIRNGFVELNKKKALPSPLGVHIGINTGNVLSGLVGAGDKKDFTVMGDTVNLASRLESAAEIGQIYIGPETYQAARNDFEFKEHKPINLKGKEKPVPVYEVISEEEKIHQRLTTDRMIQSEMVGRAEELNLLINQISKAQKGNGSIVNVIGEAGIGKSRLIAELKNREDVKEAMILEGRALSIGRTLSFYPIIEILKQFTGITEDDSETDQQNKLKNTIKQIHPHEAEEIFPFVASLMGMKLAGPAAERVKGIEGEALEKLIFKNLRELIIKSAEQTTLIFIIEDLHWADTSSIDLISSLSKLVENRRIVFLNVFRPHYEETGDKLDAYLKENHPELYSEISVNRLDTAQSDTLIDNLLKIEGLPAAIRDQIKKQSEGNPFFIEEVIRSFLDQGIIERKGNQYVITDKIGNAIIPNTIQELLMSRIDRLDEDTKSLLKAASVIGRNFFHKLIAQVSDNVKEIDDKLDYLQEIQLVRQGRRSDEVEYLFKHALAQEVTYDSILLQKRKELHLRVGQAIESIFTDSLNEFYGVLAYHFNLAEDLDKTEEYMEKAGEEAMKASASSEAMMFYIKAIELYTIKYKDKIDKEKLAGMERNLGMVYYSKGYFPKAIEYFDKALKNFGVQEPSTMSGLVFSFIGSFLSILKKLYFPSRNYKRQATSSDQWICEIFNFRNLIYLVVDAKLYLINTVRNTSYVMKLKNEDYQSVFDQLGSCMAMFILSGLSSKIAGRLKGYIEKEIEINNISCDLEGFYGFKTVDKLYSADKDFKIPFSSVDAILNRGDFLLSVGFLYNSIHLILVRGDFTQAQEIIDWFAEVNEKYKYLHAQGDFEEFSAQKAVFFHQYDEAEKHLKSAMSIRNELGEDLMKLKLLGLQLEIEIDKANFEFGLTLINQMHDIVNAVGKMSIVPHFYVNLPVSLAKFFIAKIEYNKITNGELVDKDNKNLSLKWAKEAVKTAKIYGPYLTEAYRLYAQVFWLIGNQHKALKWFQESIDEGQRNQIRFALSHTYFEVGKRLLEPQSKYKELNGITADEYLEKARVMFEEMDMQWDLEQLEKVKTEMN